jgi:hypothetical protein
MRRRLPRPPCAPRQRGQQDQGQHHRQVLDDEPADRDAAAPGIELAALLQRRITTTVLATDRDRPNTMPAHRLPAQQRPKAPAHEVATAICTSAPGTAMFFTRQQVA